MKFIRKSYEELFIGDETLEEMKKIGMKLKLTESLLNGEEKNIDEDEISLMATNIIEDIET